MACGSSKKYKKKNKNTVVNIASSKATLKRKLRRHLHALGFRKSKDGVLQIEGSGKDVIRAFHGSQRGERLNANSDFISELGPVEIQRELMTAEQA